MLRQSVPVILGRRDKDEELRQGFPLIYDYVRTRYRLAAESTFGEVQPDLIELVWRWRAWVLRLLGVVSKRDLLALQTRLDTLTGEFDRQTALLERANLQVAAATSKL